MKKLIEVKNLIKDYHSGDLITSVLKGVSFDINQGEFLAIMGPSGSGKSTLMHILSFLDRLTSGTYIFQGINVLNYDDDQLAAFRNDKIGFIFQSFNLLARTTVLDNVKLPLMYGNLKDHDRLAREALARVGLSHRLDYYTNQLSGGEKQRVAIARALVTDPAVIFADEPTGNLDSKSGNNVMYTLQNLNEEGRTVILVTHEMETALHAKRILRIKDGYIQSDEEVKQRRFAEPDGDLVK